jgi:hypothetical protein
MKKILVVVGIFIFGAIIKIAAFGVGSAVGKAAVTTYNESQKTAEMDRALVATMNKINSQAPVMVDRETRLDNANGLNHQLQYNYTLIHVTAAQVAATDFAKLMQSQVYDAVCKTKAMQVFPKNGVPVSYTYRDMNGAEIGTFKITPEQCSTATM